MPTSSYPSHAGGGVKIDSRTQATGEHRSVVVVGDPTAANTLAVNASGQITAVISGTVTTAGTVTNTPVTPSGYFLTTLNTTNAGVVKASAGTLHEITIYNPTASAATVKLFNLAAAPTVGTSVPFLVYTVPAGGQVVEQFGAGKRWTTGIAISATALPAVSDTTAAVAGVQVSATYV